MHTCTELARDRERREVIDYVMGILNEIDDSLARREELTPAIVNRLRNRARLAHVKLADEGVGDP